MQYVFYICLGLLPSLIWLSFYLKKDKNPEPNSIIIRIFIWGILLAPLAIILELSLIWIMNPSYNITTLLSQTDYDSIIKTILAATLIPALVEEYLKYSIIKHRFLKKPEFDEPTDIILYCIIAGLGFAAIENILVVFKISFPSFGESFEIIIFRFLGATLLHALACGIAGYWLALGILNPKKRKKFIFTGLTLAIVFHCCYNYFITTSILTTAILLLSGVFLVSSYFKKLKKQKSICKISS